ncbi:MAG TPA: hypothetical protein VFS54_09015 [Solirubrobacterales bacterium]|nr:hypothetical protein [Solirubrobacterales bacterium]
MAVVAREAWTDERLDDLAKRMDRGFDEVKGEIRDLRLEVGNMQRAMIIGFASIVASTVASAIAAVLVA